MSASPSAKAIISDFSKAIRTTSAPPPRFAFNGPTVPCIRSWVKLHWWTIKWTPTPVQLCCGPPSPIRIRKSSPAVSPRSAPGLDQQGEFVYVVKADNTVERRPVTLGVMIGNMQLITSGITPGENVIVDGTHKVCHGAQVNPISADPSPATPADKQ